LTEKYATSESTLKRVTADAAKFREDATNEKCRQEGVISELTNRTINAETGQTKAREDSMEREKLWLKEQRRNEEISRTMAEQKIVIDTQKIANENLTRQHKDVFEENIHLSSELTDAKMREVAWTKEKALFTEDLAKAMKHQKYLYNFLKEHNFAIVEATS
jgi:hypothetical protein